MGSGVIAISEGNARTTYILKAGSTEKYEIEQTLKKQWNNWIFIFEFLLSNDHTATLRKP